MAELSKHPVATRLSLNGPMIVARDIAHAKLKERLDRGGESAPVLPGPHGVLRRPGEEAGGTSVRLVWSNDRGTDGFVCGSLPEPRRQHGDAGEREPLAAGSRRLPATRWLLPGIDRRPGGAPRRPQYQEGRGGRVRGARHGGDLGRSTSTTSQPSSSSTTRATTSTPS